ncbi:protein of unknown function [Pseudomonas sp. JV551A1]|nr:protein of unknown function [Pseudomonas sp. JV551A1]
MPGLRYSCGSGRAREGPRSGPSAQKYQQHPTSLRAISYSAIPSDELSYAPCRSPSDCPGKACSLGLPGRCRFSDRVWKPGR